MNLLDDKANDEADRHAQMMQGQRKGRELKKRVYETLIKNIRVGTATTDEKDSTMKSDHAAHLSLVHDAEQNHVAQHQVKQANEAARQRKHQKNIDFWQSVMKFVSVVTVLAVSSKIYLIWS